jgi:hypothetical protein
LSDLGAEWFDRASVFSLGLSLNALGSSSRHHARDAATRQLLCSVASKLLRFLCSKVQGQHDTAASTHGTPHGNGDSSSSSDVAARPRQVAASLASHILQAISPQFISVATSGAGEASANVMKRAFDDTGELMLLPPCAVLACYLQP